jgi:hypothetical protein
VKLYRSMKVAADGLPEVAATARTLGVRRGDQVPTNDVNAVAPGDPVPPGTGGMSVAPDDPANLPKARRPAEYGGLGKDPVWVIDSDDLPPVLEFRQDSPTHGLVEPAANTTLTLAEYEAALESTRGLWRLVTPNPQGTTP